MISYLLSESGNLRKAVMTPPVSSLRAEGDVAIWRRSVSRSRRDRLYNSQIASSPAGIRNDESRMIISPLFTPLLLAMMLSITPPAYAQGFDSLMNELSGSEVDQVESEVVEKESEEAKLTPPPSSTELTSTTDDVDFETEKNIVTNWVTLQGLDKQTARVFIINAAIGQTVEFGTLKIIVQHCEKAPIDDRQESIAFVRIIEAKQNSDPQKLFSGWMFSSSPALSALDHPTYDVWIKECKVLENK